ncbi:MAG: hypothetical protein ACXADC_05675 [Candidatus Thorarchaeota archaeon]|jgi:hypothetical protein
MQLVNHLLLHGTVFGVLLTVYLLAVMKFLSPRIWAMSDYPPEITERVPPQTDSERRTASLTAIPFLILGLGFPIVSTMMLEASLGGNISLVDAFLNLFGIMMFGTFGDLVILDLLIVGTITPNWVIIPGTEDMRDTAYKDFRKHHGKAHIRGTIVMAVLSLIIGGIIVVL